MCKNQERIIDQFAGYALPQCVCAIAFVCPLLTFLLHAHKHILVLATIFVGAHMCSGIGLFAYFTLIMFYGKLLLVCGCFYGIAHLLGYYISENITNIQQQQQYTQTTMTITKKMEIKEPKLNINWKKKRNNKQTQAGTKWEGKNVKTKAVQVNKSGELKMNFNKLQQYCME